MEIIHDKNEYHPIAKDQNELMKEGYQEMAAFNLQFAEDSFSLCLEVWPKWESK